MDDPHNGGNQSGNNGQPSQPDRAPRRDLIYAENMRKRMQQELRRAQTLDKLAKPYVPEAERQTSRIAGPNSLIFKESVVFLSSASAYNRRSLENSEAEAIVENLQSNSWNRAVITLTNVTLLAYCVQRRYKRIPPAFFGTKGIRYSWPVFLTIGYSIPIFVFLEPACLNVSNAYLRASLEQDPRVQNMSLVSKKAQLYKFLDEVADSEGQSSSQETTQDTSQWEQSQGQYQSPILEAAASSWRSRPEPQQQEQTRNDAWDSGPVIDDDASPVAASYRSQSAVSSGGSAWDRVRQQSKPQENYGMQQYRPPQNFSQRDGWGETQEASPGYGGAGQGVGASYSSASSGRDGNRDQAQKDFDRLLEQERKGVDQENKRWR